jgi:hypothetical protein
VTVAVTTAVSDEDRDLVTVPEADAFNDTVSVNDSLGVALCVAVSVRTPVIVADAEIDSVAVAVATSVRVLDATMDAESDIVAESVNVAVGCRVRVGVATTDAVVDTEGSAVGV